MEVVTATPLPKMGGSDSPFRDHDVREWSRLDTITGALERAKLETDSWTAMSNDGCHKYGKVLDTRARTSLDGSLAAASRQFEVFQSKSTAGTTRVQVVKTQTVSSSRWTSGANKANSGTGVPGSGATGSILSGFENLQLAVNPLDLTSQKSKASVGRSVSRRPPTRRREDNASPPKVDLGNPFRQQFTASQNLHRVSRLCHQIHETAVRHAFGVPSTPSISERESGDGSASGVEIVEIESTTNSNSNEKTEVNENTSNSSKCSLVRTKSTSSENINQNLEKDNQSDFEDLATWRRESKVRRSLQFPKQKKNNSSSTKPSDLPENSVSVKKIREELEKGRRLSTALRNSSLDLVTLDQIIQSVSSNSSIDKLNSSEEENSIIEGVSKKSKQKRDSFVTVESIKEVKDRLRRTSSPLNDIPVDHIEKNISNKEEQNMRTESKVKSYVFGMENLLQQNKNKKSLSGSLESKTKVANGTITHKSEDWYNRRKSYGFEKVHGDAESEGSALKSKKPTESSTDSGICRSNEMVPTTSNRKSDSSDTEHSSDNNKTSPNGIHYGNVRKMTSIFNSKKKTLEKDLQCNLNGQIHLDDLSNDPWRKINSSDASIILWTKQMNNNDEHKNSWVTKSNINDWKSNDTSNKLSSITVKLRSRESDTETKRHSIDCDDFSNRGEPNENRFRKISSSNTEQLTSKHESSDENNRKTKKVEFCKTEIHFAAETGKVNIVETDEKPPPSQNFRRRRRNSGPTINYNNFTSKNGLPVTHFGDNPLEKNESFEKMMFGISDDETSDSRMSPEPLEYSKDEPRVPPIYGQIKAHHQTSLDLDYSLKEVTKTNYDPPISDQSTTENDNLKGILKNKMKKPKPYLLGDIPLSSDSDGETHPWNIKPPTKMFNDIHDQFRSNLSKGNHIDERPKYQATLKTVRPTKFPDHPIDCEKTTSKPNIPIDHPFMDSESNQNRYSDSFAMNLRVSPVKKDVRPNSWSVTESSENDKEEIRWVSARTPEKDSKPVMNHGLVVRIGNENSISKHTLCNGFSNKYPEGDNYKTTSTKIAIDITPCLSNEHKPRFTYTKFQRSHNDSFKSTPLVLDTIRTQNQNQGNLRINNLGIANNEIINHLKTPNSPTEKNGFSFKNEAEHKYESKVAAFKDIHKNRLYDSGEFIKSNVSQQLESLKKLYENNQSDSEVDHEVQELMSTKENDLKNKNDDSLASKSWKRVSKIQVNTNTKNFDAQMSSSSWKKAPEFKYEKNQSSFVKVKSSLNKDSVTQKDQLQNTRRSLSPNKAKLSPLPLRKTSLPSYEISNAVFAKDDLSSPSLVTKNSVSNYAVVNRTVKNNLSEQPSTRDENNRLHKYENIQFRKSRERTTCSNKIKTAREMSPNKNKKIDSDYEPIEFRGVEPKVVRDLSPNKILRQPKDSEMIYFGVKSEHKVATNVKTNHVLEDIKNNKPDLIQHCKKRLTSPNRTTNSHAHLRNTNEHTYENVNYKKKEFDSSILDELTKAADQILQAVNGYTDEDSIRNSKYESEDDYKQPLDTISETKSWKTSNTSNIALHARKPTLASAAKVRVKRTSSTSSIESLSRDRRGSFGGANERQKKEETVKTVTQKEGIKKKALSDTSSIKTSTKATRRIQRACSRELLLQSHGSSSEDLQLETPVRKPRLVKKTKTSQVTVNTGLDLKRPERERKMEKPVMVQEVKQKNAFEERAIVPEIKHKPALSVVRNMKSEKISRDRSRQRSEDRSSVAKLSSNRESSKVSGTVTGSSRSTSKQSYQPSSSRLLDGPQNKENSNVTQHRISTANIKKCRRTEGTKAKH